MSEVTPWIRSGFFVAAKAIRAPSGDQEKAETLRSAPLVRCLPFTGAFNASATSSVKRCAKA